jgi:hypothetical protein
MVQIPVLSGIFTDANSDFRNSYPRNLIPVPKDEGISKGYIRPADGIVEFSSNAPGIDRGGINWDGVLYRVMGSKLVSIDEFGAITTIGDVDAGGQVTLDYSFDFLGIASNKKLFLFDKGTLKQNTDEDLGDVIDFIWIDGFFMTTDGLSLVVTELNDPFAVNPLKFGSSEIDPDPIVGLLELNNEAYALNRFTIEVFENVGGLGFPFQRIESAAIRRGCIGTHAKAIFLEQIAFMGGARNEATSVWLGISGQSRRIATREIDQILAEFTETQLADVVMEVRVDKGHQFLYIHLPDRTIVYDGAASAIVGQPIWFTLGSSVVGNSIYKARNLVRVYDKWIVGDPTDNRVGRFVDNISSHYGELIGWDFGTIIVYNGGFGAVFHRLELVSLTGRSAFGDDSTIWMSYSFDGVAFSQEFPLPVGKQGDRNNRIAWLQAFAMNNWAVVKFRGTSDAHMSIARLEATLEPLNV